jgi:hypothetical protein
MRFAGIETLESRQLLSVTLSNFEVSDPAPTPGQVVVMSVDVQVDAGDFARAATFFRDVNGNGGWDEGVDQDLGATTDRQGNTFRKSVQIPTNWTGTARILANAVTGMGVWADVPVGLDLRVNQPPQFLAAGVADGGRGSSPRGYAQVADDTGVRAVTFFLDRNNNGRWDTGLDTSLGTVFRADLDGFYRMWLPASPIDWPAHPQIGIDAVDADGEWAGAVSRETTYYGSWDSRPPEVSTLRIRQDWGATDGKRMTLSVDAGDNSAVRAVTFFADHDGNGEWTPNVDESLGTVYRPLSGHTYSITITTDFGGRAGISIVADAVDFDGQWSRERVSGTAFNGGDFVESFGAVHVGDTRVDFDMGFEVANNFGRLPPLTLNYYMFHDVNKSGAYESDVDTILDAGSLPVGFGGKAVTQTRVDLGTSFSFENWYGVAVSGVSAVDFSSDITSPVRIAVQRAADAMRPTLNTLEAQTALFGEIPRLGATFRLTGTWSAPRGARAVTFFWDKDLNGRWDVGTDIDLGWQAVSGVTGQFDFQGRITEALVGYGSFTASVADVSTGAGAWSVSRSDEVAQVFAAPRVRGVTVHEQPPPDRNLTIDVGFMDDRAVRAATGFIDTNGDGLFNGADGAFSATTFSLLSGTRADGTMRLTLNTAGLARGEYTVYLAVSDYHRGDVAAPGGEVNGLWSQRFAVRITVL